MADPVVTATPYNPLLTYQFRIQLMDPPGDATPEQVEKTRTTLSGTAIPDAGSRKTPEIGDVPMGFVAGVRRVSGLTLTVAASETWEGGNSLHRYANPHRAVWEPILLEQGISTDTSLQKWAEAGVQFLRTGTVDPAQPVKRNVLLGVFANAGDLVPRLRYVIFNAWVSKYQAIPRLDAMADEVALLSVELTHHGWRQDPPPDPFATPD